MILKCFAVLDIKAGYFSRPWFFPATGEAIRAFQDLAGDLGTTVGRHPADFALYEIAAWDDSNARFDQTAHFVHLGNAVDYLPRRPAQEDLIASAFNKPFREVNPNGESPQ